MVKLTGIQLIANERDKQIVEHSYTAENDVIKNKFHQLTYAAMSILKSDRAQLDPPIFWSANLWKKMIAKSEKERLIISASLIAAELDRLQAAE